MLADPMRLNVVPGLTVTLGPKRGGAPSALIHIAAEKMEPPSPDGNHALEVALSRDCLRMLLGGDSIALHYTLGGADGGSHVRIPVESAALVRRISDDIRHTLHRDGARTLFLQGKVLELLAAGLSDPDADLDAAIVVQAQDILRASPLHPPSIPELSRMVGLSSRKLNGSFRAVTGMTVFEWLVKLRLDLARDLLLEDSQPVRAVSQALGYGNVNNFINAFTKHFGIPPGRFRSERALSLGGRH